MRKKRLFTTLSASELKRYDVETTGMVNERSDPQSEHVFLSRDSLLKHYRRELIKVDETTWSEEIEFEVYAPGLSWLLAFGVRRHLSKIAKRGTFPFWHPPTQLDPATVLTVWTLIGIAFLNSYYATLLGQLLTFTAKEFHSSTNAQGIVLGVSRLDIVPALLLLGMADKIGRTKIILVSTAMGAVFSALGALSPNLYFLAVDQVLTKAFATAAILLIAIVSSEVVPAAARAWSLASLVIGSALGAGAAAFLLPIAGLSLGAWRILFGFSIFALLAVKPFSKYLKESRRYSVLSQGTPPHNGARKTTKNRNALILLSIASFLLNLFFIPASQFRNQFLRHDRGFSATSISAFTILTAAPGAIGLAVGGRLSETKGRRVVGSVALVLGTGGLMLAFLSHGLLIWVWAVLGSIVAPATIPSLGVYGTELFPTRYRGRANGVIGVWSRIGSIVGVVLVGYLGSAVYGQVGIPLAIMGIGPLLLALIVFFKFPETKGLELETLNPEDSRYDDKKESP